MELLKTFTVGRVFHAWNRTGSSFPKFLSPPPCLVCFNCKLFAAVTVSVQSLAQGVLDLGWYV